MTYNKQIEDLKPEIKTKLYDWFSEESKAMFKQYKEDYGTVWPVLKFGTGTEYFTPYSVWIYEGRQIRNVVREWYKELDTLFDNYGNYEDFIYELIEEMF
jgi:hypothetical protein